MTSRDFAFWLQGFFEIKGKVLPSELSAEQVQTVKNHLAMVFKHDIDPSFPAEQQADLDAIHVGKPQIGGVDKDGIVYRC